MSNFLHATLGDYSLAGIYDPRYDSSRIFCSSPTLPRVVRPSARRRNATNTQRAQRAPPVQIFHASPYELVSRHHAPPTTSGRRSGAPPPHHPLPSVGVWGEERSGSSAPPPHSVFVARLQQPDIPTTRGAEPVGGQAPHRLYPREHLRDKLRLWAPVHFAMLLDAPTPSPP